MNISIQLIASELQLICLCLILSDTIRTTDQNNVHFDSKTECPGGTLDKCNEICYRHVYSSSFVEACVSRCQYLCQNKLGTGRNNVKPYIIGRYDIEMKLSVRTF